MSREELHAQATEAINFDKTMYHEWLKTRPEIVQKALHNIDPYSVYRCVSDHTITGIGTIGVITGATEEGQLIFEAHVIYFSSRCDEQKKSMAHNLKGPIRVHLNKAEVEIDILP